LSFLSFGRLKNVPPLLEDLEILFFPEVVNTPSQSPSADAFLAVLEIFPFLRIVVR